MASHASLRKRRGADRHIEEKTQYRKQCEDVAETGVM